MCKGKNNIADIVIWGTPPPPFGGMTVHISRLVPKLLDNNLSVRIYAFTTEAPNNSFVTNVSQRKLFWYLKLLFGKSEKVHYVMSAKPAVRSLAVLFGVF